MIELSLSGHVYFLPKAHPKPLVLRDIRQHFSTVLGAILNRDTTNEKHSNVKNTANKETMKKDTSL